jgi:hypothetical protein
LLGNGLLVQPPLLSGPPQPVVKRAAVRVALALMRIGRALRFCERM